jgi:hypothetical protein
MMGLFAFGTWQFVVYGQQGFTGIKDQTISQSRLGAHCVAASMGQKQGVG